MRPRFWSYGLSLSTNFLWVTLRTLKWTRKFKDPRKGTRYTNWLIQYLNVLTVIPILVLVRIVRFILILESAFNRSSPLPSSSPAIKDKIVVLIWASFFIVWIHIAYMWILLDQNKTGPLSSDLLTQWLPNFFITRIGDQGCKNYDCVILSKSRGPPEVHRADWEPLY